MSLELRRYSSDALAVSVGVRGAGRSRRRSGARWKFAHLPPDLQTLIFELVDIAGPVALLQKLGKVEFVEWLVPLEAFPYVSLSPDYRDETYFQKMLAADLPPIILCNRDWIDGRHRISAWRRQGCTYATAIDLAELGVPLSEFRLAVLSS